MVAFLTEADPIQRLLIHIGEPATPPRIAPARAPPDWLEADFDQTFLDESEEAELVPGFEFDQTVRWTISRVEFFSRCSNCLMGPAQAPLLSLTLLSTIRLSSRPPNVRKRCHFCPFQLRLLSPMLSLLGARRKGVAIPNKLALKFLSIGRRTDKATWIQMTHGIK